MINQPFLQLPLRILLTVFATFTILRAGLLISNWDQFSSLTVEQIIWAFVYGLRFDASTIAVTLGLPMLLLFVPQRFFSRKKWISLFLIVIYVLYISLILTVVSDSVYFSYLQRHIGSEITLALDDPELLKDMILGDYAWAVVLFLALSLLGAKLWYRAFSKVEFHAPDGKQFLVVLIVSIALIVVSARGGFQYKPVKMADAFAASDSTNEAYLMINGAFAFQHSLRAPKASLKKFMTDSEALSLLHRTLSSEADEFVDGNSMVRQIKTPSTTEKKPNVVLLLLESVDAEHFDAIRTQQGKEPLGLTPNLDHLAKEGLLFTNFYANGRRSIEGLAAILASVPSLPTLPFLGKGLEQNRLSFIGDLAYHQGYNTVFLQSSKRNSFHIDAIAKNSGFRTYLGAEDVTKPAEFSFPTQSDWGVWDHYTFDTAADTFKARQPFFGMIFTSTTHNPFRVPDKQWEKFSDDGNHSRYMNTVFYADWAVGRFIEKSKKLGIYENTIWIITADHIGPFGYDQSTQNSKYHIPLLIIGPGIQAGVSNAIGSHIDLMPTIADLLSWGARYASVGKSLLRNNGQNRVFAINDTLIDYFDERAIVTYDLNQLVSMKAHEEKTDLSKYEKELQAKFQITNNLILQNQFLK